MFITLSKILKNIVLYLTIKTAIYIYFTFLSGTNIKTCKKEGKERILFLTNLNLCGVVYFFSHQKLEYLYLLGITHSCIFLDNRITQKKYAYTYLKTIALYLDSTFWVYLIVYNVLILFSISFISKVLLPQKHSVR